MQHNALSAETEYQEPSFEEQFARFVEVAQQERHARRWLYDSDTNIWAYVRESVRPIGPPIPGTASIIDGKPYTFDVQCLDIANVEYRHTPEVVDAENFARFLSKIYHLSPWKFICLDQLEQHGPREITKWCIDHGWETDERTGVAYIHLPEDPKVVLGTAETVAMSPAYLELPSAE